MITIPINYTDRSINEIGSFELVEFDGSKFIIDFAKTGSDSDLSYNLWQSCGFQQTE